MAGKKIADVSPEDRTRIAVLYKLIKDLESQIATTVGNYVGMKDPRVVAVPGSGEEIHLQVVDQTANIEWSCGIYRDPPGICEPCPA